MKNWIKVLLGAFLGAGIGAVLPAKVEFLHGLTRFFFDLSVNFGKYIFIPLVFFSLVIEVYEMYRQKTLKKIFLRGLAFTGGVSLLAVLFGTALTLLLSPQRLSHIIPEAEVYRVPGLSDFLLSFVPSDMIRVFFNPYGILFPVVVLTFLIGVNLSFDRLATKSISNLFDSFSKLFQHINTFVVDILWIMIFFISLRFSYSLKAGPALNADIVYFILFLVLEAVLFLFVFCPALLFLFFKEKNPYKLLFGLMTPALTAFLSGDVLLSHAVLIKHNEKNSGVDMTTNSFLTGFFAAIFRPGTIMMTVSAFLMILKSQSGLTISFSSVMIAVLLSLVLSLYTGTIPVVGSFFSVIVMCGLYGVVKSDAYNLLVPLLPILFGLAAFIDTVCSGLSVYLIARQTGSVRIVGAKDFY